MNELLYIRMRALAAFFLVLFLTGCDDPTNVGLGALDEVANPPQRIQFEPQSTSFDGSYRDVTGGTSGEVSGPILVGSVNETGPLAGVNVIATGFVDFLGTNGASSEFRAGPVTAVELRLFRESVYGDTTSAVNLQLFDMTQEWSSSNARYDSTFSVGGQIVSKVFSSATDSIYSIPLPSSWISTNEANLRATSTQFNDAIHGFQIRASGTNAILGFNETRTTLRVVSGQDTLDYFVGSTRFHSNVVRSGSYSAIGDFNVIQDNTGDSMELLFDFEQPGLLNAALASAVLRIPADTLSLRSSGTFKRTYARQLSLFGETPTGSQVVIATGTVNDESEFEFRGQIMTAFFQNALVGRPDFSRLFVGPSRVGANSLDFYLISGLGSGKKPTLTMTLIPNN